MNSEGNEENRLLFLNSNINESNNSKEDLSLGTSNKQP